MDSLFVILRFLLYSCYFVFLIIYISLNHPANIFYYWFFWCTLVCVTVYFVLILILSLLGREVIQDELQLAERRRKEIKDKLQSAFCENCIVDLHVMFGEEFAFLQKKDGLAELPVIGRGGGGQVYKAISSSGLTVAVKKIIQLPQDAEELSHEEIEDLESKTRRIKSEIEMVSIIRHRNLLPPVAYVPRPEGHYLVYPFMRNGSLLDVLCQVWEGKKELDWPARLNIMLGVADGLVHLHMNCSPRIIHRDLKPSNILLDDNMEAKISDFGIAKSFPDDHTHATISHVVGTAGYMAPECSQTLMLTEKCDIYSFGVLLGVLVIGKLPSDDFFQDTAEVSLVKWMRNVITSDDPTTAIDPRLIGNGFEDQMLVALKIASLCTLDNLKERPSSADVQSMLSICHRETHREKVVRQEERERQNLSIDEIV